MPPGTERLRQTPEPCPRRHGYEGQPKSKKAALDELRDLERKRQKAADAATDLGRQHFEARKRLYGHLDDRGLLNARVRLMDREPDKYNPDGSARRKDSVAGRLEAEINNTPDLAVLAQKVEHARRLEKQAKEELDAHVTENVDAILQGLQPDAEGVATQVNASAQELSQALDGYLGFHGRVSALVAVAGRDTRGFLGWTRRPTTGAPRKRSICPRPSRSKTDEARARPRTTALTGSSRGGGADRA